MNNSNLSRIHVLSPYLASQIAAGEVVERPSSVVKELMENSLDAGADNIEVHVEYGGIKLIRVRDNGYGIVKEDLPLALHRHATSKLHNIEDLAQIISLGFRGEALASISAVSKVAVISRSKNSDVGWQIYVDGIADEPKLQPASHPFGTTVEVRDIFFNVPARRKFLRTAQTEYEHLLEIIRRIALGKFEISLALTHNDKQILHFGSALTSKDKEMRLASICGENFVQNAIFFEAAASDLKVTGWLGTPLVARGQPDLQYFYINGRIIKNKNLAHAVKQAYQDLMPANRYPAFVLYLNINPASIDVNVHPAKSEVRFHEARLVHDFIYKSIKQALAKHSIPKKLVTNFVLENTQHYSQDIDTNSISSADKDTNILNKDIPRYYNSILDDELNCVGRHETLKNFCVNDGRNNKQLKIEEEPVNYKDFAAQENYVQTNQSRIDLGFALTQLHDNYILAQNLQGLVVVDVHAAHERITYEQLKKDYARDGIEAQCLLIPLELNVSEKEAEYLEQYGDILAAFGLSLDRTGPTTISLRQVPVLLKDRDLGILVSDILSDFIENKANFSLETDINKILATLACHRSIRGKRKMSIIEMNALLRNIENTENAAQCSHGRPTWIQLSINELHKLFSRC